MTSGFIEEDQITNPHDHLDTCGEFGQIYSLPADSSHSSYFLLSYFLPATKSPQTRLPWKVLRPYRFRKIYLKPIQKKNLREGLVFFTDVSSSKPICKLLRNLTNKLIIAQNIHTVCRCRHFSYCLDSWNNYSV